MSIGWSAEEMARRIAGELVRGEVVNLGIGMPTLVARHTDPSLGIIFHSENGIIGMGPAPAPDAVDGEIIDAGKAPVTLLPGAAIIAHDESFAIIRGGHLDTAVLGAYQVSVDGDLANWRLPDAPIGSVGGAMDIAVGARRVIVMMKHTDKQGEPKLVAACTYPLTARQCINLVVTDLAVIAVTPRGFQVREVAEGVERDTLQRLTGAPLVWPDPA